MPAAAVSLVGTAIASRSASKAADRASSTLAAGNRAALEQRDKFFNIGREDLAPYREIGEEAVQKLRNVFIKGDMDKFYESPGYQFNLEEGEKALERKQGAAGSRFGGRALKEATTFAQGQASNEFGNFFNQLNSLAGLGANAAARTASLADSTGSGIAGDIRSNATNQANLTAKSAADQNAAIQSGLSNLTTLQTYNDLQSTLDAPDYDSGSVTTMPSIFNR